MQCKQEIVKKGIEDDKNNSCKEIVKKGNKVDKYNVNEK